MRSLAAVFLIFTLTLPIACGTPGEKTTYKGKTVKEWVRQLEDADSGTAYEAYKALRATGRDAIPSLIGTLDKERVGLAAGSILEEMSQDSLVACVVAPQLLDCLADRNKTKRSLSALLLAVIGHRAHTQEVNWKPLIREEFNVRKVREKDQDVRRVLTQAIEILETGLPQVKTDTPWWENLD